MKVVALIPARGGSKGIPRKNLQPIGGIPLVARAILTAKAASRVDRVLVSTDDPEIASVARSYGAEVVMRPADLSGDTASSESALLHALDQLEREGDLPDLLVFLQCTSPLLLPEDVDGTIETLIEQEADSAFTGTSFYHFIWKQEGERGGVGVNHDPRVRPRRQEREGQYLETGGAYVMRVAGFRETRHRFFGKTALYLLPQARAFEIDEPLDLVIAEALHQEMARKRRGLKLPAKIEGLALDFDGVFTDNHVVVFQDGREAVLCSRSDGWGLARLKDLGLPMVVISTELNPVVEARCMKLGIPFVQGAMDKVAHLQAWTNRLGLALENVIFVGNDVNDLPCLRLVGCPVAVADSHPEVLSVASLVLDSHGGKGALRELAELIQQKVGNYHGAGS